MLEKLDYLQVRLLDQMVAAAQRLVKRLAGWRAGGLAIEEEDEEEAAANRGGAAGGAGVDAVGLVRSSLADAFDDAPSWPAALLSNSLISEPAFEELVVAWRPEADIPLSAARDGLLEAIDADGDGEISVGEIARAVRTPEATRVAALRAAAPPPAAVELRLFRDIPIANWQLALPFCTPSFQLKDWARIDLITLPALLATLATLRFDDPRLEVAAASAVAVWLLRAALGYRNSIVLYELLLNRFLVDKISIRGDEVRRFARREARRQRARRAAALLEWLRGGGDAGKDAGGVAGKQRRTGGDTQGWRSPLLADELVRLAEGEIGGRYAAAVSLAPALRDLQRLGLVRQAPGRPHGVLEASPDGETALQAYWNGLLKGEELWKGGSAVVRPVSVRGARRAARRTALEEQL